MMVDGKWLDNISCKRCHRRHPAELTCAQAQEEARKNHELPPQRVDQYKVYAQANVEIEFEKAMARAETEMNWDEARSYVLDALRALRRLQENT